MKIRICLMIVTACLGCLSTAVAQDTDPEPVLYVSVRGIQDGDRPARDSGIQRVTKPGDVATTYLLAGGLENPAGTLCATRGIAATPPMPSPLDSKALAAAAYVWKITTTTGAHAAGRLTVDVDWQRFDQGAEIPVLSRKQRVVLNEGERYPLDLVLGNTAACPVAIVELTASVKENPAFADTVLRYDLWLVRHDKSGRKQTRQLILSGVHGQPVHFQFAPLVTPVPKLQPDQYDFNVATRVSGSVRGRLTGDGRVSVDLETRRRNELERPSRSSSPDLRGGPGGRKVVSGALGEAIEIELPPASGFTSTNASERDERERAGARGSGPPIKPESSDAVVVRNGRLAIYYNLFFEGERLSLIVQVRKAEGAEAEPVAKR